jgi:uncharacterized protein (TIGR03086 family)
MELVPALEATFDRTQTLIAGVRPDQLGEPTPCAEWDVRALLAHVTGVVTNMGLGVSGQDLLPDVSALELAADPAAQFRDAAATTLAAWKANGLQGEVNVGAGPMPAAVAANINLLDTATHAWDIATATGQDGELPAEVAEMALAAAHMVVTDDIRKFAGFSDAQPVGGDASPTRQLAAYLGRKV